jgi:hypothetical protein
VHLIGGLEQRQRAVHGGEDPAAVDVANDDHRQPRSAGEAHVDDVAVTQVDLRRAAGALADDGVVAPGEVGQAGQHGLEETWLQVTVVEGAGLADGASEEDDLARAGPAGLEEHGVHRRFRLDTRGDGLHRLGATDLRPASGAVRDDGRVQRHVLGLERRDSQPAAGQPPADPGGDHALAGVGRRPGDEQTAHGPAR